MVGATPGFKAKESGGESIAVTSIKNEHAKKTDNSVIEQKGS